MSSSSSPTRGHRLLRAVRIVGTAVLLQAHGLGTQAALAQPPLIDPSVAGFYTGREVTVEAPVQTARRRGNVVELQIGQAPHTLQVSLVEGLLHRFPADAEQVYRGKTIRVSGKIREFRGRLEMIVRDPANLLVLGTGTANPIGEAAAPPAQTERIRSLEQRLEALESRASTPSVQQEAEATGGSGGGDDQARWRDIEERLRKIEFRVRQLEQKRGGAP